MSPSTIIRLSNLSLILSGSLSVLGIFAFQAGWLKSDVNTSSASVVTLSFKQDDQSKLVQAALNNPVSGKVNVQIFSEEESPLVMQELEFKDHPLESISKQMPQKNVIDETTEINPVEKGIHSFALMLP